MNRYTSALALLLCCLTIQGGQSQGNSYYDEHKQNGGLLRGGVDSSSGSEIVINPVHNGNEWERNNGNEWERSVEVQGNRDLQDVTTRLYIFQCFFTFTGGSMVPDAEDFSEMVRRTQIFYNRQVGSNYGQNFRSVVTEIKDENGDFTSTTDTEYRIQFTTDIVIKNIDPIPSQDNIKSLLLNFDRTLYLTNFADMIIATNVAVAITALSTEAPTVSAMPSTSAAPSLTPSISPAPSLSPSSSPSDSTPAPSVSPSMVPSNIITEAPSAAPSRSPSAAPTVDVTVTGVTFEFIDDDVPAEFNAMNLQNPGDYDAAQNEIKQAYDDELPNIYSDSFVEDSVAMARRNLVIPSTTNSVRITYDITATFRTNGNVPSSNDFSIDLRNLNIYDQLRTDIESLNRWGGIDRLLREFP